MPANRKEAVCSVAKNGAELRYHNRSMILKPHGEDTHMLHILRVNGEAFNPVIYKPIRNVGSAITMGFTTESLFYLQNMITEYLNHLQIGYIEVPKSNTEDNGLE